MAAFLSYEKNKILSVPVNRAQPLMAELYPHRALKLFLHFIEISW